MFPKTMRPSSTAATMVAKLSSSRVMPAASLLTSVPAMPIAMPTSAFLRAGASLTPSPVIATTSPRLCQAVTTRSLSAGETRAYTAMSATSRSRSSSLIASRSRPETTRQFLSIPSSLATALAVSG